MTETLEKNVLIAERVPPGDRWKLITLDEPSIIYDSLTDVLDAYYQIVTTKPIAFRLDFRESKLYAIYYETKEVPKPEPKRYNIYGEFI